VFQKIEGFSKRISKVCLHGNGGYWVFITFVFLKKPQIKAENEHKIVFILKDIPSSCPHLTRLGFKV